MLAELAGLGVAHVDPVADPEADRDLSEQRRLDLAGALEAIEVQAGRQPGDGQVVLPGAPEATYPPPRAVTTPASGRRTTGSAKPAAGVSEKRL